MTPPYKIQWQPFEHIRFILSARREFTTAFADLRDKYGDTFWWDSDGAPMYVLTKPEHIRTVLATNARKIKKDASYTSASFGLRRFFGNGLVTSEGSFWKRQRKTVAPAFHTSRINAYADTMTHYATAMVDRWRDGEQLDVNDEMMAVTLDIIAATLLKDASNPGIREIPEILHFIQAQYRSVMMMPSWVVEIALRRTDSRVRRLDEIVYPIIEARRATGGDEGDILSMLLNARDDDGVGMTDLEVRDEIVILFLAGHETTANTLNWTFYLLSQHPDVEAKLHKEVDRVLAGRVPTLADLQSLPYTAQVVKEAMRLYPPVPYIGREVVEDIDMGDFTLPAGSMVSILQYLTHRDGQIWDNPLAFDPDRFSPERENEVHKWAFFPFGGGARVCIGNGFAMMEAPLVLATVASRYRLELAPGAEVVPQSSITLYPKHGLSMIARRRDPELTQPTREDRVVLA